MKKALFVLLLTIMAGTAVADSTCKDDCARKDRACNAWCAHVNDWEYKQCKADCKKQAEECNGKCE